MGPSGFTAEGIRNDMSSTLDYVYSYRLGVDVSEAVEMLKQKGVFK